MVFGKAFCKLYIMACRTPFLLKAVTCERSVQAIV